MPIEISGLGFDIGPALAGLDRLSAASALFKEEQLKNSAAITAAFSTGAVQNQIALSNAQATQQADLRATAAAIRSAQDEVKRLTQAQRELEQAQKKATNTDEVKRLTGELEKNRLKILEAKAAVLESKDAAEQERTAVLGTIEARRQALNNARLEAAQKREVTAATKAQAAAEQALAAAVDKSVREAGLLVQLEKQLTDLIERRARATTGVEAKGYTQDINAVTKQIADLKGTTSEEGGGFFSGLLGKVTAATGGLFAFNSIANRVKQGLDDYGAIKGVQATLNAVAGSAAEGGREFAYIKEKSDELGLSLVPTGKAYAVLFAATKEANISVGATRDVFEGVTSAAKVLNLTGEDTNGILLALQQIASKGVVSAEELRGQMGERLPTAFGLAAKAMGLTTQELDKQLRTGKILASDFLPKFGAQLKATYGDATADAAEQVGSNLGRIDTFFANSSARLGATFAPFVALVAQLITPLKTTAKLAEESASAYYKQADASKALQQTVTPLLARYEQLNGQTTRNATEQRELDSVIQQLAKTVPGAVTQFNEYGKALGINGEAVRKFIENDRNLTRYRNEDSLQKNTADLRRLVKEQEELTAQLNNTVTGSDGLKRRQVAEASSGGTGGGGSFVRTLSQAESDKITADYAAKLGKVQDDIRANLENRQQLRGYSPLLPKAPTSTEVQGLIEKQQQLIKDIRAKQSKAAQENKGDGADYLLGAGGLDEQLDKAEKELQRLLGKVEAGAKAAADRLAAALKTLYAERETLRSLAAKASVKVSDDQAEQARLAFEEQLKQVDNIAQKLREAEARVKKAGGKGANADGKLDAVQEGQLSMLRAAAQEQLTKELARIARERQALLLSLQQDSDQTELDRLEAAFQEQMRVYEKQAGVRLALEAKYERDREALLATQATRRAQHDQQLASSQASATAEVYGAGTGQSVYEAQFSARQQQLDADKTFAEKRLDILKDSKSKEADEERAALAAQLLRIRNQQRELTQEVKESKFSIFRLVLGKEDDNDKNRQKLTEDVNTIVNSLSSVVQAQEQAAQQQIDARNRNIDELQAQIQIEVERHAAGSASNLKGLQDALVAEKQARSEAIAEKKKAQKEEQLINELQQVSALATASANILVGFSELPIIGQILGVAAIASMLAAFIATKAAAGSAVQAEFFTGGYTGSSTGDLREERGVVHAKEFVHTAEKTTKYRTLFDALHNDTPAIINWELPQYKALLPTAPIILLPDLELPDKLRAERQASLIINQTANMEPLRLEMQEFRQELRTELARVVENTAHLQSIESTNTRMADRPERVPLGNNKYIEIEENGSTHVKDLG